MWWLMPRSCQRCGCDVWTAHEPPSCLICGRSATPPRPPTVIESTEAVARSNPQMTTIEVLDHEREAWERAGVAMPG